MTYTYEITQEFKAIVKDQDGNIIDTLGPWQSYEGAEQWASEFVDGLNLGVIPWPPVQSND